ncbi:MAG: hypothetical protein ACRD1U_13420 [Vicinamibacterales bacterium]
MMSVIRACVATIGVMCAPEFAREAEARPQALTPSGPAPLKVFLDCQQCFQSFLRTEVTFADYVRDRGEADVHVLITVLDTGGGGREYTVAFLGQKTLKGADRTLRTVTALAAPDDVIRRQLANTLRVGLLGYTVTDSVPPDLAVSVRLGSSNEKPAPTSDRWNHWVFSLRGAAAFQGEESSRETQLGGSISADRITPTWKMTLGAEIDHETEEFDLDEDDPVKVRRRERDFSWLVVRAFGEHWSAGAVGEIESSTFENMKLLISASPAIEYNFFPYSAYTRRQLRALYSVGPERHLYHEVTLFGKTEDMLAGHEVSLTFEQREPWGTLEARTEWSQYLHDLSKSRLEVEADIQLRLTRGLSFGAELNASRIRDQLSLPARGASPEEILLRLRQLESGYEYNAGISLTYSFGSIFSSIINPRFGQ